MNIESLLNYQNMDGKLWEVERKLSENPYKKKAEEISGEIKRKQARLEELSKQAQQVNAAYVDFQQKYETTKAGLTKLLTLNVENATVEKLDEFANTKNKILKNLEILGNYLNKIAKNIHVLCAEAETREKEIEQLNKKLELCKQKFGEESKTLQPEIDKLRKELASFEKNVDAKLLKEYKEKRQDNIFPVIVPLEGDIRCGRCRMELPKVAISRIKENGVIICEHCKRFIYQK